MQPHMGLAVYQYNRTGCNKSGLKIVSAKDWIFEVFFSR